MVGIKHPRGFIKPKFTVNETKFACIDNEHAAYFLGLICADGYLPARQDTSIGIDLDATDRELLDKFALWLEYTGSIKVSKSGMARLWWTCARMRDDLNRYGLTSRKSYVLPDMRTVVPSNLLPHFVRGLSDGDGSWNMQLATRRSPKRYLAWSLRSTPAMCSWLLETIPVELNYLFSRTGVLYSKRKQAVRDLGEWMYKDASIYLPRKHQVFVNNVSGP